MDGRLTLLRFPNFGLEALKGIVSFAVDQRHENVEDPKQTISSVLFFLSVAPSCPSQSFVDRKSRKWLSPKSSERDARDLMYHMLKRLSAAQKFSFLREELH